MIQMATFASIGVSALTTTTPATVSANRIAKKPIVCGGHACIRDSRIPVWVLVNYRRLGGKDSMLLRDYPTLSSSDLEAAWDYASSHTEEIDFAIRENEDGEPGHAA